MVPSFDFGSLPLFSTFFIVIQLSFTKYLFHSGHTLAGIRGFDDSSVAPMSLRTLVTLLLAPMMVVVTWYVDVLNRTPVILYFLLCKGRFNFKQVVDRGRFYGVARCIGLTI
jgi:hypothetical protein